MLNSGTQNLTFTNMYEFLRWKEKEEENNYVYYVQSERTYRPKRISGLDTPIEACSFLVIAYEV